MDITNFSNVIKNLISQGKTKSAIKILREIVESEGDIELTTLVISISADYTNKKHLEISGQLKREDIDRNFNELNYRILATLQIIESKLSVIPDDTSKKLKKVTKDNDTLALNLQKVYKLLKNKSYSKKDIFRFCKSEKQLRKFIKKFKKGVKKDFLVLNLIDYADEKKIGDRLLNWAKNHAPKNYEKNAPFWQDSTTSINVTQTDISLERLIEKYREHLPKDRAPRILISGSFGNGKSTTINTLFGEEIAGVGYFGERGTEEGSEYKWEHQSENVSIIDVPGLGDVSKRDQRITKEVYKKYAKKVDGIIVIVAPPRLLNNGTEQTIRFFLDEGVPSNLLIFGLNKINGQLYKAKDGSTQKIELIDGEEQIGMEDKIAIDKIKINFIKSLKETFPQENFNIDQVVEYDAVTGWNIYAMLLKVVEILPYQALRKFDIATRKARAKLKKKVKYNSSSYSYYSGRENDFQSSISSSSNNRIMEMIAYGIQTIINRTINRF